MSSDCNHILNILKRNGTERSQDENPKLNPENFKLHDFDLSDWLLFALNFSYHIHFFPVKEKGSPLGDWSSFFSFFTEDKNILQKNPDTKTLDGLKDAIQNYLENGEQKRSLTPHLTLFIAFLKLLEKSQERFNQLTKRHLDFYYSKILHMEKQPIEPDHVYIIFELAKNINQTKIDRFTALDGGKDSQGKKRNYLTLEEAIVNKTQVSQIKNVYNEIKINKSEIAHIAESEKSGIIVASPIANSYDGLGADFPENDIKWWPFGYTRPCSGSTALPLLPPAKLGFSLASKMLRLREGAREIIFRFGFLEPLPSADDADIAVAITIELTGEKGWVKYEGLLKSEENESGLSDKTFTLILALPPDFPAIVPYQKEIHQENYEASEPMVRVFFKTQNPEGYNLYRVLNENPLQNINIEVRVSEVKNVRLENDFGLLNPEKPFFPFTPRPLKGSSFKISYPETVDKPVSGISFQMDWLNTPDDFESHYQAYVDKSDSKIVNDYNQFKVNQDPASGGADQINLFTQKNEDENGIKYRSIISADSFVNQTQESQRIKLTLENTFLHEKYAHYFTMAAINNRRSIKIEQIPNEPYTPLAENLNLSYTAIEEIDFSSTTGEKNIELFHEEPFGQYQRHPSDGSWTKSPNRLLIPSYCNGGELYIGLEHAENLQQVSLLFQVLEGSENPSLNNTFTGKQKIEWSILAKNKWVDLDSHHILINQSPTFLKTGIFKFIVHKEATNDNTRLPAGYHWLRATMKKPFDAVCQFISIKAQAVEAKFENQNNSGDHLENGLPPDTISKLQQKLSTVKGVHQPYPSFGGKNGEDDSSYYRRISKRLRHKNRAISLWDYEHLILQNFPKIYKVKCLNHTCENAFQSPGNVTLILVPDTVQQTVFDIYQPRVSKSTLNEVGDFINELNSFHVQAKVINPNYEEVRIKVGVKFKKGMDENFYLTQTEEDIKKFLSPWAYDQERTVEFGVTLHKSQLIHYLEQLNYIDYLENLQFMTKSKDNPDPCNPEFEEVSEKLQIQPSNPKSILVSAKKHDVKLIFKTCSIETSATPEECQR